MREVEERFGAAIRSHCAALWLDPEEWAGLLDPSEICEELAGSPVRGVREEIAALSREAPDLGELAEAIRLSMGASHRRTRDG